MRIEIIGSGVVGLTCAHAFAERGCDVSVITASRGIDFSCCSWWAGGMLAVGCELESAEPLIGKLGLESMVYWKKNAANYISNGTLVLAPSRDLPMLKSFSDRTHGWHLVNSDKIIELEPDLSDVFYTGLYFPDDAHIEPRKALSDLEKNLCHMKVNFSYGNCVSDDYIRSHSKADWVIDCRGLNAHSQLQDLRGVKGEMLTIQTDEVNLSRPIRLLHPRIPVYIVPRPKGVFMVGATMIENNERHRVTVRSVLELLNDKKSK